MSETITLSKSEYEQLKNYAAAYQKLAANFFDLIIKDAPVKSYSLSQESLKSISRAERDYTAGRVRKIKSLKSLIK